jgi:DedD protein
LRKDGFDGHAKDIEIKGAKAVRVLSGPFVNRKKAEKMKRELDKRYKVQSLIIYFDA